MKKVLLLAVVICMGTSSWAGGRQDSVDRLKNAGQVLNEIMATPDKGIPQEVFDNAKCIAVVPRMVKAAIRIRRQTWPRGRDLSYGKWMERSGVYLRRWWKLGPTDRRGEC